VLKIKLILRAHSRSTIRAAARCRLPRRRPYQAIAPNVSSAILRATDGLAAARTSARYKTLASSKHPKLWPMVSASVYRPYQIAGSMVDCYPRLDCRTALVLQDWFDAAWGL